MSSTEEIARPTAKARRTRERILDVSLALFQERGFEKTSMREIASGANLSLGATYYHFKNKDDLVFAFYARTQESAEALASQVIATSDHFETRMKSLLGLRLDHLSSYRGFFSVLARQAFDFNHPLSPFGPASKVTRDAAIEIMSQAIEGSDLQVHPVLKTRLPSLLWLVQMGIIFLWIHDSSAEQSRTARIVDLSLPLMTKLLTLTSLPLPGVGPTIEALVALMDEIQSIATSAASTE